MNTAHSYVTKLFVRFQIYCNGHKHTGSFHVNWSRQCNQPSQIFMKFGMLVELLFLIPNIPFFFKIGQLEPKLW